MIEGRLDTTIPRAERLIGAWQAVWLLGLLVGISVLLALAGDPARLALRYERAAVLNGEFWRLISGHFVHATFAHLLLNMVGLGLIAALFPRDYTLRQWMIVLAASVLAIDVGFVLFEPQLEWYVGLSGVLHGALAAGAVAWWRHETKPLALLLSAILISKLTWEQWRGALPLSGDMTVVVNAHLYGAVGGLLAGLAIWGYSRRWSRSARSL